MSATKTSARPSVVANPNHGSAGPQTVDESSLPQLVRELSAPDVSDEDVTRKVFFRLQVSGGLAETLWPAVAMYVITQRRGVVRREEQRIVRSFTPGDGTQPASDPVRELSLEQLREFAEIGSVQIPGAGKLSARVVTVEQWNLRIGSLRERVERTEATIDRYCAVVATLTALGADTIDQALKPRRRRGRR